MLRGLWIPALLLGVVVAGCGDETPEIPPERDLATVINAATPLPGAAAITVNGRGIPVRIVEEQVRAGRSKDAVVRELTDAELFYDRALSMNYAADDAVQQEYKRLMIKRLLRKEVEETNLPSGIAASRVKAYYDKNLHLYYSPELRAADHLLVKPTSARWQPGVNWKEVPERVFADAGVWGARIHADMVRAGPTPTNASELERVAARWKAQLPADLEIVVESLPPSPRRAFGKPGEDGFINAMVPEFSDAMFAQGAVGTLSAPAKTLFGTHILVLTQIVAEDRIELESADEGIREFLATGDRRVASRVLLTRLLSKTQVRADDTKLDKLGAQPQP